MWWWQWGPAAVTAQKGVQGGGPDAQGEAAHPRAVIARLQRGLDGPRGQEEQTLSQVSRSRQPPVHRHNFTPCVLRTFWG